MSCFLQAFVLFADIKERTDGYLLNPTDSLFIWQGHLQYEGAEGRLKSFLVLAWVLHTLECSCWMHLPLRMGLPIHGSQT